MYPKIHEADGKRDLRGMAVGRDERIAVGVGQIVAKERCIEDTGNGASSELIDND